MSLKTYLALGDSYTIGERVAENERWPFQLAAQLTARGIALASPRIIAKTGWRTDELEHAIENLSCSNNYDLVSLLIGVNNQYQGKSIASYRNEFERLLVKAIELAGGNRKNVFVLSIPDYGKTPFGKAKPCEIGREIDLFNSINKYISDKYKVSYFDITPISRKAEQFPELVTADNLHPSGKMYAAWVGLMIDKVAKLLI